MPPEPDDLPLEQLTIKENPAAKPVSDAIRQAPSARSSAASIIDEEPPAPTPPPRPQAPAGPSTGRHSYSLCHLRRKPRIPKLRVDPSEPNPTNSATMKTTPTTKPSPALEEDDIFLQEAKASSRIPQPRSRSRSRSGSLSKFLHPHPDAPAYKDYSGLKSPSEVNAARKSWCRLHRSECLTCRQAYEDVAPDVDPKSLDCPEHFYPVILDCQLTGTMEDAREFVKTTKSRLRYLFGEEVPTHAAVRLAPTLAYPAAGPWFDITSKTGDKKAAAKKAEMITKKNYLYRWEDYERMKSSSKQKGKSLLRDLSMLIDFSVGIQDGGDIQNTIINGFPGTVRFVKAVHSNGDPNLLRLAWWAKSQPELGDIENFAGCGQF
ncbi:hypothetical protein BJX61DRAFT_546581 [Aspergillus egyptiacus]|nr:hypothetical protein BJX61DRAFT_546581 [Aspergillus egyptiacus]